MEGKRPSKGRKSLLTQQAELAGLSFTTGQVEHIIQDLPNFKENAANPNLRSRWTASSLPKQTTLTTPLNQQIPVSQGSSQSHIPVPRRLPHTTERSTGRGSLSRPGPSRERGSAQQRGRVPHPPRPNVSSAARRGRPIRRSMSYESFQSMNMTDAATAASYIATPLSRGKSQSPGPLSTTKKSALKRVGEMTAKTLQAPLSTEKPVLNKMMNLIVEVLRKLRYEKEFTVQTFKMLNVKDFHGICIFLLTFLVGPNAGPNKKDEQTFILDGVQMLSYPGTLSKSHLKTPNVPHTQPIIYTLLSWLCCRVDSFLDPQQSQCNILSEEAEVDEIAWESYTRLFFRYLAEKNTDVADELEMYRERIKRLLDDDMGPEYENLTKESIQFLIDEKQVYKDSLFMQEDPRADIQSTLKAQDEMLSHNKKTLAELEQKKNLYTNLTRLESEATVLKSELFRLRRSLTSLQETVSTQKLSREAAEQTLEETATLKKQQESAEKINQQLYRKVQQQEQFLTNDMSRFYDTCSRFSFLDMYNNMAKNYEDIFPLIDKNPLEPLELKKWLKDTLEKVTAAKRILDIRMVEWQEREKIADTKFNQLEAKANSLQTVCDQAASQFSVKYSENSKKYEQLENEAQKARAEFGALRDVERKLVEEIMELKNKQQSLNEKTQEADKSIAKLTSCKNDLDNAIEEAFCVYHQSKAELNQWLLAFVIDARSKVHAPPTAEELGEAALFW